MAKKEYMRKQSLIPEARLNFLLGCSEKDLGNFELARLAEVANLRTDLHMILDKLMDEMAQAALAGWFRQTNRETLQQVIQSPEEHTAEILAWANERIRSQGKSGEERVPRTVLAPGAAHLAAALRYQERNIAQGLCAICPTELARGSVRFCERHLAIARARNKTKGAKRGPPGSIDWLYSGVFESTHGKQPGSLKALAEAREKRKRREKS